MSKNLTRKGFAFGALVALGASVFAGTPAFAADSMVLAGNYSSDTTLATAITETYTLNASLAPGSVAANIAQLKYKVVNNGSLTVVATPNNSGTAATVTSAAGSGYATGGNATASTTNTLALSLTSATSTSTTQTVTVTAFLDANGNSLLDSGETQATQTVSFVKYSEITSTTTITAPTEGDTTATAVVKFTNINNQSLTAANVGGYFTNGTGSILTAADSALVVGTQTPTVASGVTTITTAANTYSVGDVVTIAGTTATASYNGTYAVSAVTGTTISITTTGSGAITVAGTVTRVSGVKSGVAYSATAGGFKYTAPAAALVKNTAVKVQPLLSNAAIAAATGNSVGSSQTASVTARALGSFTGTHVLSTTAASATAAASVTDSVALNTTKQVYFLAKDTATPSAAKAGQAITVAVSVTGATLGTAVTLTVNGTTYTSAAALPGATGVAQLALTTGTDGKAVITYTTSGFANGNAVVFTATAENRTATVTGTEATRDFTTATTYIANVEGDAVATVDGTGVAVNVVVQDQFGGAPADGTYTVTATFDTTVGNGYVAQATTAATTASSTYAAVVGGKANLTITDNGTGVGTNLYVIELRPVSANGVLGASAKTIAAAFKAKIVAAADAAAGAIALTGATTQSATTSVWSINTGTLGAAAAANNADLTYSAYKSVDMRGVAVTAPSFLKNDGATAVTAVTVGGTVSSASTATYGGVAVPNASVTFSGTGMAFSATQDGVLVYGDGSLTISADASGNFSVNIYSHKAGANTVTIKSGTGSASLSVSFKAAAELDASAVSLVVADGASQFQAGRALDVTVTVADAFGNPVALDTTWAATTDAKLTIAQTGSGYLATSGDVVVTSTGSYATKLITNAGDLGTSTITATLNYYDTTVTDVVKTVSSEFGVTDADVTVGGRAVYASVEFAKGKTVTVSVDGKRLYSKLFSTDAYTELKFTQKTAGKHTVTVRVSGGIVYSEVVTTTK